MERTILILSILVIFSGFVSAEIAELESTKVNDCIQIINQDYKNASSGTVTFVRMPNGQIDNIQKPLQNRGNGSFNYSYCNTGQIGTYTANGIIDEVPWNYKFRVTPSGFENLAVFLFIFLIIIVCVYVVGFKLENAYVMFFASTLVLVFGFFIFKYGVDVIKDQQTTYAIAWVVWAMAIMSFFLSIQEMLKEWR